MGEWCGLATLSEIREGGEVTSVEMGESGLSTQAKRKLRQVWLDPLQEVRNGE